MIATDAWVFDYHGVADRDRFFDHTLKRARQWWPGWTAGLVELPPDALLSGMKARSYAGLHLRERSGFLDDPLPRARAYLDRLETIALRRNSPIALRSPEDQPGPGTTRAVSADRPTCSG